MCSYHYYYYNVIPWHILIHENNRLLLFSKNCGMDLLTERLYRPAVEYGVYNSYRPFTIYRITLNDSVTERYMSVNFYKYSFSYGMCFLI